MTRLIVLLLLCCCTFAELLAQENRTEDGVKVGRWAHKDERGFVYAEGNYTDGIRTGRWLFFISPVSRVSHTADVKGSYDDNGQKMGKWTFANSKSGIILEANFETNLMDGTCTYYTQNGDLLATGLMNAGIRHGQWIFYQNGKKMTEGFYKDGLRVGDWVYDYYPENNLHVKGTLNFADGRSGKNGKLEYYRVDYHPKFGTDELLSGLGSYSSGKKMGRWIEYEQDRGKPVVNAGAYNRNGKRQGFWKTTIDRKNYRAAMYENGVLNGRYLEYHDNGKIRYETNYENGLAVGPFKRYYSNGKLEEEGTTIFSSNPNDLKKDTIYLKLELPFEYTFQLVDLPNLGRLNYNYITWLTDPSYSIEPAELDRRFAFYKDYGLEPTRRIKSTPIVGRKSVRKGSYKAYYKNGQVKLEGTYYPKVSEVFNPETNTRILDFARDGEWKQYDDNGYLMRTMTYEKGELLRMLDDKGNEMGLDGSPAPASEGDEGSESEAAPEEEKRRVEVIKNN